MKGNTSSLGLDINCVFMFFIVAACFLAASAMSAFAVSAATHDAIITITPEYANCNGLGNIFILNVENDVSSADSIFEGRIYSGTKGISEFYCGPAPLGWTLSDYAGGDPNLPDYGYCEYKTEWDGPAVIDPSENLNFTFNATMWSEECFSEFLISTLDNKRPEGEHEYN
ncbi:MAG: hypothetical protein KAS90_04285, partial [Candidatus Aenigmarchaeota archaeon]|nr:hypothetical protein [Candidatus Aenigmarchaeota archaeon]